MPSYAILGATGNTGGSVLRLLLQDPSADIHVFVRSKAKLLKQNPTLDSNPAVTVYEGSIDDVSTISACVAGTKAIFLTVAVIDNVPGCTIAIDTAQSVVSALQGLHSSNSDMKMPRLVVLSSQALDDHLSRNTPSFAHSLGNAAFSNIYQDLRNAEAFLRSQGNWLSVTFVKPGGLSRDIQRGHKLSTEGSQCFISFLDLAAGMVEIANAGGDKWDMKNVSVAPKEVAASFEWMALVWLIKGLLVHFFPALYPWLKS